MRTLFLIAVACLLMTGCASQHTNGMKFEPVNPAPGRTLEQDEATCRAEFNKYRSGFNSNWFSGAVYRDCMIAKGYREVKPQ